MIDTGLFYKYFGMEILSPKKQLRFCFGNTTRNVSSPVKDSGITHRGCTKAETGTVTKDTSNDLPILTPERKKSTADQSNGFSAH
jgi:hypothetical protein